ncbi:hypothetical protein K3495_g16149, partial [Podosphaera aphanis]
MPVVRQHHSAEQKTAAARARKSFNKKGLAHTPKAPHASEADNPGKNPRESDSEMIDAETHRSIEQQQQTSYPPVEHMNPNTILNMVSIPKAALGLYSEPGPSSQAPSSHHPSPYQNTDWDHPEFSSLEMGPLDYDDPLDDPFEEPTGPIQTALSKCINNVQTRAREAEALFGNITAAIDSQCVAASRGPLSKEHSEAVRNLCQDLAKAATRHFNAFLAGKPVLATEPASSAGRVPQLTSPATYASVVRQKLKAHAVQTPNKVVPAKSPTKPAANRPRADDRLFVRLPEGDKLRDLPAYALQCHLKAKLGNE